MTHRSAGSLRPRRHLHMRQPLTHEAYRKVRYFGPLDGVRALAVLAVATWHVKGGPFNWLHGERGVTVFFVLSGFLITTLGLREESSHGSVSIRGFFVRRVFRILPLYYVVLLGYCVLVFVVSNDVVERDRFLSALPFYVFYLQELPGALGWDLAPFSISWSLGIEEKFYVVWPLTAFWLFRDRSSARINGILGLMAAIIAFAVVVPNSLLSSLTWSYLAILVGCLLATLLHDETWFDRLRWIGDGRVLCVTSVAVIGLGLCPQSRLVTAGFALLAALAMGGLVLTTTRLATPFQTRPAVWLGNRSYGFYLVHVVALTFAERLVPDGLHVGRSLAVLLVGIALASVAAALLHRVVELPMIAVGRRFSGRRTPSTSAEGTAS